MVLVAERDSRCEYVCVCVVFNQTENKYKSF